MNFVIITQLKNQEERIYEWLDYHVKVGFDSFIIFDDFSEDNTVDEIREFSEKFPEVKIVLSKTDGIGGTYSKKQCLNSESYGWDKSLNQRITRSYTAGNKIAREINPDSICAIIDVDEFIFTDSDLKVTSILQDIFLSNKCKQVKVINFDVLDNYQLQKNLILNNLETLQTWNYKDLDENSLWRTRSKCIIKSSEVNQITFVHDILNGQFPKQVVESETYTERNYERLRLLHFRKPNLPTNDISFNRDENTINKFKKILNSL